MALRLSELRDRILFRSRSRAIQFDPQNDATQGATNLNFLINQWKNAIIESHSFAWRKGITTMATVGQFSHDLPGNVQRVRTIYDISNNFHLRQVTVETIREADPDMNETGDPEYFCFPGSVNGKRQIGFWRLGTATLHLEYDKAFDDLTDNDQTLEDIGIHQSLIAAFEKALIEGCLIDVYEMMNQAEKINVVATKYQSYLKDLAELDRGEKEAQIVLRPQFVSKAFNPARLPSNYPNP